jgi:hypothetical protein
MHNEQLNNLNVVINNIQQNMSNIQGRINNIQGRIQGYNAQHNNLITQQADCLANSRGLSTRANEARSNYDNAVTAKNAININNYQQQVYHAPTYSIIKVCNGHGSGLESNHINVLGNVWIGGTNQDVINSLQNQVTSNEIRDFNMVYIGALQNNASIQVIGGNVVEYGYKYTHHNNDGKCNDYSNSSIISVPAYYSSQITAESHRQFNEAIASADARIIQCNQIKLNIAREEEDMRARNEENIINTQIAELNNLISQDNDSIAEYRTELTMLEQEKIELKTRLEVIQAENIEILKLVDNMEEMTMEIKDQPIDMDDCTVTNTIISMQDIHGQNEEMLNMGDITVINFEDYSVNLNNEI